MSSKRRQMAAKRRNKKAGSLTAGEPVFLAVGRLQRPHGLKGEIQMGLMTDFPERLQPGVKVFVGEEHVEMDIETRREHTRGLLIRFGGHKTREDVDGLRNRMVYVRADDRPKLPEGEYYQHEIVGLTVMSEEGEKLGVLSDILETGANNVYIVRDEDDNELLLPAIDEVILEIDLKKRTMKVHLLDGLRGAE
ncbi:MAG: ribosome maturation factor RimM [Anaerolineae bacterium]|nr:ribosome maturation factor RimM [Anaerolineae bacterium]